MRDLEIVIPLKSQRKPVCAALFDFDGTLSTLRHGWEAVMGPLMIEMINGEGPADENIVREVEAYIDESTGIQTIFQMQWLADTVKRYGKNPEVLNPWQYKAEYNRRLMKMVENRVRALEEGKEQPENYIICGSKEFLNGLKACSVKLYLASGTDHPDVVREARALGLADYFEDIAGAPLGQISCSKEAVLRRLAKERGLLGEQLLVVGDGKVEIGLGREFGAITLGAATDEIRRTGVNEIKRKRLIKAGAHAITGDFLCYEEILSWLNLS